jgi:hypothetical protein
MCTLVETGIIHEVTPDDLLFVQRSWARLRAQRVALVAALARRFGAVDGSPIAASDHAEWLYGAVDELVDLLATPSRLAGHARAVGATWPDPCTAPSFEVEGRAWLAAADECLPVWSDRTAAAWKEAWFLLSDVLAAEALSPFGDRSRPLRTGGAPDAAPGAPARTGPPCPPSGLLDQQPPTMKDRSR